MEPSSSPIPYVAFDEFANNQTNSSIMVADDEDEINYFDTEHKALLQSRKHRKRDREDDNISIDSYHTCHGLDIHSNNESQTGFLDIGDEKHLATLSFASSSGSGNNEKCLPMVHLIREIFTSNIPWAMYVFFVCTFFVIAAYITHNENKRSLLAEIMLTVLMCFGLLGQCLCFRRKRKRSFVTFTPLQGSGRHSNHYLMVGVYVFGTGTLFAVLLRMHVYYGGWKHVHSCGAVSSIPSNASSTVTREARNSTASINHTVMLFCYTDVIYDAVRLLFTLCQIAFLQTFHAATFRESVKVKFLLYHTMLTNLCIWTKYLLQGNSLFAKKAGRNGNIKSNTAMDTCIQITEQLTPFILEYSLIAAGLLHGISSHMKPKNTISANSDVDCNAQSEFPSIFTKQTQICNDRRDEDTTAITANTLSYRRRPAESGSQPGLIIGILFALLFFTSDISFDKSESQWTARSIVLNKAFEMFAFAVQLVVGIVVLVQLRFHSCHKHEIRFDDTLLLIGMAGTFSFVLFALYSSIVCISKKIHKDDYRLVDILTILELTINTLAQVFQAVVIQFSRRYLPNRDSERSRRSAGLIRQLTLFLLIINFGMWAQNSFIELHTSAHATSPCGEIVFPNSWNMIVAITFPFAIFYRFHSASMLFEFWMRFAYTE
eukprot:gene19090-21006_t